MGGGLTPINPPRYATDWILRQIIKTVATRCQILRLKCTKFNFGPRWGSLQRSPRPPAGFKGAYF